MDHIATMTSVTLIRLHVTDEASSEAAVARVRAVKGRLDYLVSNSGTQHVAPALETDLAVAKSIFDACHALWMDVYQASKAAVDILNETMLLELHLLQVRVVSSVTGAFDTNIIKGPTTVSLEGGVGRGCNEQARRASRWD
ncbi:hypothetical protein LLEC1_04388 [Akanthomyces lecanii]|uniref:Ketoreductase (KR) domain-containing protein n=1 Tax=Cordyceps confragosa TaxID=2714763 RepID=A0A179IFU8_CORDF|nr:hypothetical protein LLEC1_04388 [Akanthomyces lecanii]